MEVISIYLESVTCMELDPAVSMSCVDEDISLSFDSQGWVECDTGMFLHGLYRGTCSDIYCIETMKCCGDSASSNRYWQNCHNEDISSSFDGATTASCGTSNDKVVVGMYRHADSNRLKDIDYLKCCEIVQQ